MAQFSQNINKVPGLRFIADALQLQSPLGRQHLMKLRFMTSEKEISLHLEKTEEFVNILLPSAEGGLYNYPGLVFDEINNTASELKLSTGIITNADKIKELKQALSEIRDISGTLNALHAGMTLDDIGLFEIKRFALIVERLVTTLESLNTKAVQFSDVSQIVAVLDPDKQLIAHFYIYDSYSEELAELRKQYQSLTRETLKKEYTDDPKGKRKSIDLQSVEELRIKCIAIEDDIRKKLSLKLRGYSVVLLENLASAADLDLWLSKAILAVELGLKKPKTGTSGQNTFYRQLFNPAVREALKSRDKEFQPVDIEITQGPSLITGANMAGKTVLLKTVALAQYLYQYGFYIPAEESVIIPVDKIMSSMEDEQSEYKGLSSFAAEMMNINAIITASRSEEKILALIDEPARTTNPVEGEALVSALLEILLKNKISSLITTHYTINASGCRRLRVAGLRTNELSETPSIETIQDFMDYSLMDLSNEEVNTAIAVPHEALTIAELLNIDKEFLNIAERYLRSEW